MEPVSAPKTFKALVIDGGGVRALYTLYLLRAIQSRYGEGKPLSHFFDMIIGTSTGSLIAVGIGLWGTEAIDRLINIYEGDAKLIFPNWWYNRVANWMRFFAKGYFYDNGSLIDIVNREIGPATMSAFDNLVCVPSYNLTTGSNHLFRTPYDSESLKDIKVPVKDAVLASCAAPLYFNSHRVVTDNFDGMMVDGGIWANNPTLVANFEYNRLNKVLKKKGQATYDECVILNLGNIDDDRLGSPSGGPFGVKSLIDWIVKSNSMFAEQFTGNEENVRVQRISSQRFFDNLSCFGLDDVSCLATLRALGKDHGNSLTDPTSCKFVDLSRYFSAPKTWGTEGCPGWKAAMEGEAAQGGETAPVSRASTNPFESG